MIEGVSHFWTDCVGYVDGPRTDDHIMPIPEILKNQQCSPQSLTSLGYSQMNELGVFLKQNYLDKYVAITDFELQTEFISTDFKRTISSLTGVVEKLFPQKLDKIRIRVYDSQKPTLLPNRNCPKLSLMEAALHRNEAYSEFESKNTDLLNELQQYLSLENPGPADGIYEYFDNFVCLHCLQILTSQEKPATFQRLSDETIGNYSNQWKYELQKTSDDELFGKLKLGEFFKELKEQMKSEKKLIIYCGHDISIAFINSALKTDIYDWPPYGSAFIIEVWKNGDGEYVRLISNGQVAFPTYAQKRGFIKHSQFLERLQILSSHDISKDCEISFENTISESPIPGK